MRIFSDLGQGGRGDGAAIRGGLPRPGPQLRGGPQHAEVRLLRREHLHLDTQGDISIFIITMIISHKVPWTFAIKSWFSEKDLFRYGLSGNNLTEVRGSECGQNKTNLDIKISTHTLSIFDYQGWPLHSNGLELQSQSWMWIRKMYWFKEFELEEILRLCLQLLSTVSFGASFVTDTRYTYIFCVSEETL